MTMASGGTPGLTTTGLGLDTDDPPSGWVHGVSARASPDTPRSKGFPSIRFLILQGLFNLSENAVFAQITCSSDLRRRKPGGYMKESTRSTEQRAQMENTGSIQTTAS